MVAGTFAIAGLANWNRCLSKTSSPGGEHCLAALVPRAFRKASKHASFRFTSVPVPGLHRPGTSGDMWRPGVQADFSHFVTFTINHVAASLGAFAMSLVASRLAFDSQEFSLDDLDIDGGTCMNTSRQTECQTKRARL